MSTCAPEQLVSELDRLQEKVIDYLQDVHAMEQNVLRMLDSMVATTTDAEILRELRRHRFDTERHEKMVRERLEMLGSQPSLTVELPAVMAAWMKSLGDMVRPDKPGRNARDAFVTEHLEIAAYNLLEQLAERAGDLETIRMARFIREDEEQMARWIDSHWGKFVDLSLEDAGLCGKSATMPQSIARGRGIGLGVAAVAIGFVGLLLSNLRQSRAAQR